MKVLTFYRLLTQFPIFLHTFCLCMRKFWTTTFESFVTNSTLKSPWVIQDLLKVLLLVYIMNIFLPKSRGRGGFAGPLLLTVLGQVSPSSTVKIVMYVTTIRRCTSQVTRFPQLTALDCMHRLVVFQTWPQTFLDRRPVVQGLFLFSKKSRKTSLKAFSHRRRAKPFNTLRSKADSFEKSLF